MVLEAISAKYKCPPDHWKSVPSWGMQLPPDACPQPQHCCCPLLPQTAERGSTLQRLPSRSSSLSLPLLSIPRHHSVFAYSQICSPMRRDIRYRPDRGLLQTMHYSQKHKKILTNYYNEKKYCFNSAIQVLFTVSVPERATPKLNSSFWAKIRCSLQVKINNVFVLHID